VTFGYKIVFENRVCQCVWISEKGVGSTVGEEDRKAAVCDNKFDGVEHGKEQAPSIQSAVGAVAVGKSGDWAGLISPGEKECVSLAV